MIGWKYQPPFPYFYEQFNDVGFVVLVDDYVQAGEGVGGVRIIHQAPAYGQEDYLSAQKAGIISSSRFPANLVDDDGC
jgi:isoleucyl-tRNA synthetase